MKLTVELTQDEFFALDKAASQPNQFTNYHPDDIDPVGSSEAWQCDDLESAHKKLNVAYDKVNK